MADIREAILLRISAILSGLNPSVFKMTDRNRTDVGNTVRPAAILVDGDEERDDRDRVNRRPPNAPLLMSLKPEIYLYNRSSTENIGSDLSALRVVVLRSILRDADLLNLCVDAGALPIAYEGASTDFTRERKMAGDMVLSFTLSYPLFINDL